jgi:trans-2,3-dihydro-3-hydroxyanthranilate isomerase
MAGHPTIGTAFVLAHQGMVKSSHMIFEEGVGPVPVSIEWRDGAPGFVEMRQPLPTFGPQYEDVDAVARMLSIEATAISQTGLPIEVVSCGVPFLFVPINNLQTIRRIRLRLDLWEPLVSSMAAKDVFVFTKEVEFNDSTVHSRMFAPAHGVAEDPATGGASGPLGCYLVRHNVIASEDELQCTSEQGIEIGRPSFINMRIAHHGGDVTGVRVGGTCHYVGGGNLEIEDA